MDSRNTVFLSYNSDDKELVTPLYQYFEQQGLRPWMDEYDIEHGESWISRIQKQITETEVFFLFVGNSGLGEWQEKEWEVAFKNYTESQSPKRIIPVILPNVRTDPALPPWVDSQHKLDLRQHPWDSREILVSIVAKAGEKAPDPADAHEPKAEPATALSSYLQKLWRQCVDLDTANFEDAIRQESGKLSLPAVYTPLKVIKPTSELDREESEDQIDPEDLEKTQWVDEAVLEHFLLVLTGDPGGGKSTFVDFLCLCLIGEQLKDPKVNTSLLHTDSFPAMVPIRVILRQFAPNGLAKEVSLWRYIQENDARISMGENAFHDCSAALEQALKQRDGAIVLLDGIDEVPDARGWRLRLRERIGEFCARFPYCRVLLTTRPYAYQSPEEKFAGFAERRIASFSSPQMQTFVDNWYTEVGIKQARLGPERAAEYAERLKNSLQENESLRSLGENPLLMSLMGWLHRTGEGGRLPENRQRLYELCVDHLIEVWQKRKPVYDDTGEALRTEFDVKRELGIDKRQLRQALENLAYRAHAEQPRLIDAHDISIQWLSEALFEATQESGIRLDTTKITHFVTNRAGILIETDQGRTFKFPHRTFQEYLAACHLCRFQFPYKFRELIKEDDERWREALLLAAAYVEKGNSVWEIVEIFCKEQFPQQPEDGDWFAVLRAAQAVVETEKYKHVDRYQKKRFETLKNRLVELMQSKAALTTKPQDRAAAGRALARIGDIRAGVGCRGDGQNALPDLGWVAIPGTADTGLKNGVKLGLGAGAGDLAREDERWAEGERGVVIEPFYMAAYPITYLQFAVFVDADDGYCQDSNWTDAGLQYRANRKQPYLWGDPQWHISNHPVVGMTWYEAVAFCRWLTARWSQADPKNCWIIRLPTEAEWEWAARGPSARRWPWGDQWDEYACNSEQRGLNRTIAVRSDPANCNWVSAYQNKAQIDALPTSCALMLNDGVFDLAGNVWEWCVTKWHDRYTAAQVHGGEQWTAGYCRGDDGRVIRGGAFWGEKRRVRGAARYWFYPWIRKNYGGFRCCCVSTSSGASAF